MQLNGERVQQAWEDYRGFITSIHGGVGNENFSKQLEQAYKMGFVSGQQAQKEDHRPIRIVPGVEVKPLEGEQLRVKHKTVKRTEKQVQQDARLVASIMQRHAGPMYLREITNAVNNAGGNWYPKSASGHMNMVMEIYPTIKKLSRGVYEYEQ